ncbi:MAG TPA: RNA-binding cell elongation regulator Jag/EloR [Candidatus Limnocylindrales bacterium]|jgi:spoIIIJ-associated protein
MSDYQEFTGKSVEDAIKQAMSAFGVSSLNDLDFEILTHGARGVLGMGAEPARIVAAPRSALGGAAPRREAAASVPLPPPPAREDRGPRDDRPRRDDRPPRRDPAGAERPGGEVPAGVSGGPVESSGAPADDRGPRVERPRRDDRPPRRDDRGRREGRPARSGALTEGEQAQLTAARATSVSEREDVQAAEASPEALAAGKEILEQVMSLLGYKVTVTIEAGETSRLSVIGDESEKESLGALIGRKGERLSALQHLVNLMLSKRMGAWTRVLVDVEEYRGRRERQLHEIADRAAARVVETGRMLQLDPMTPLERRWIHLALRANDQVTTQSIGEEPDRRVVILPRSA